MRRLGKSTLLEFACVVGRLFAGVTGKQGIVWLLLALVLVVWWAQRRIPGSHPRVGCHPWHVRWVTVRLGGERCRGGAVLVGELVGAVVVTLAWGGHWLSVW